MIRFTGSKPVKPPKRDGSTAEKMSSKVWNSRFVLGKIPNYDALKDKNCQAFHQYFQRNSRNQRVILGPGAVRVKRPTTIDKHQNQNESPVKAIQPRKKQELYNADAYYAMIAELTSKWQEIRIPNEMQQIYINMFDSLEFIQSIPLISKEIDDVSQKRSLVQKLYKAIEEREEVIAAVTEYSNSFKFVNIDEECDAIYDNLFELRIMTINVLECYSKWKDQVNSIMVLCNKDPINFTVWYNSSNYISKLKVDINFLLESEIAKAVSIKEGDPLLLSAAHSSKFPVIIHIPPNMKKTINYCMQLIDGSIPSSREQLKSKSIYRVNSINNKSKEKENICDVSNCNANNDAKPAKEAVPFSENNSDQIQTKALFQKYGEKFIALQPLRISYSEFKVYLNEYIPLIPENMRASFMPLSDLCDKCEQGIEPYYISYQEGGSKVGLLVMYIDPACQTHRRVTILHISTIDWNKFAGFFSIVMEFIWKCVQCKEVRIGQYHRSINGQFVPDEQIKEVLVNILKFKWKKLTSQEDQRITEYGTMNPGGYQNPLSIDPNLPPINYKHNYIVCCDENDEEMGKFEEPPVPLLACLQKMGEGAESCNIQDNIKECLDAIEQNVCSLYRKLSYQH